MDRKKNRRELELFLSDVISKITHDFVIDEALLYGSYAKGTANGDSDIDLAIISPQLVKKSIYANNRFIKTRIQLYEPGLQLTSFPSDTFYNETFVDPGFVQEIKRTGKSIYTRSKGLDLSCL
jgi:uncharacterized protein